MIERGVTLAEGPMLHRGGDFVPVEAFELIRAPEAVRAANTND